MPIMQVFLIEGRTLEQKESFMASVTDAAVRSLGVDPKSVRIIIQDMAPGNFGVGGVSIAASSGRK